MIAIDDSSWFDKLREWFAQAWTDDEMIEDEVVPENLYGEEEETE